MAVYGEVTNCYVFRTPELTVWIPIDDIQQHSLRTPTEPEEFNTLYTIHTSPSQTLPEDRVLRRDQLMAQLKDGQRATKPLLTEWTYALKVPMHQAQQAVEKLLQT